MSMTKTSYGFGVQVPWGQDETIGRVTAALKTEGFGVLSTIDVQATLKEKIDVDREPYVILGACNPNFANQALEAEPEIGLLLPCNVIVYQEDGRTRVAIMDPVAALGLTGRDDIAPIATEVKSRLERVLDTLSRS
jgi:uncharacterized protein (DUF302 family)